MAEQLQTFLFADISGYSRLTEIGGDEVAAELALRFASEASAIAADHGTEFVKRVGDAVMFRGHIAAEVVRLGLRLNGDLGGLPPIHAGIHTGVAVQRDGDWWGSTVNIAARVASEAQAGQLLITEATRSAVGQAGPARLQGLGTVHLKNISSPVGVYAASPMNAGPRRRSDQARHGRAPQLALFDRELVTLRALAFES
jgi:adenylate cyclase